MARSATMPGEIARFPDYLDPSIANLCKVLRRQLCRDHGGAQNFDDSLKLAGAALHRNGD